MQRIWSQPSAHTGDKIRQPGWVYQALDPAPQEVSTLIMQVQIKKNEGKTCAENGLPIASWVFAGGMSTGIPPEVSPFNCGRL